MGVRRARERGVASCDGVEKEQEEGREERREEERRVRVCELRDHLSNFDDRASTNHKRTG